MEHGNRIKVVRGIHIRIQKTFQDSILFGGVYGSTAIGRDTEFSDIEMMYVTRSGTHEKKKSFLYHGIPVEIEFVPIEAVAGWLQDISLQLPLQMGSLLTLQLWAGDQKQRDEILMRYYSLPDEKIFRYFQVHGSEIAYESLNKIRSLQSRALRREHLLFVYEVLQEIALSIALINRKPITWGYFTGIKETYGFDRIPDNYKELAESFIKEESLKNSIEIGQLMVASFEEFLSKEGIRISRVQTLDEIDWEL
jgi:kanamycin nucleotidyltransferase